MYTRARAGEEIERAPRRIRIDKLELLLFEPPRFRIAIACSKGTYIRSLVAISGPRRRGRAPDRAAADAEWDVQRLAQAIRLDRGRIDDVTPYLIR